MAAGNKDEEWIAKIKSCSLRCKVVEKLPVRASQYFCLRLFPSGETSNTRIKFDIQNNPGDKCERRERERHCRLLTRSRFHLNQFRRPFNGKIINSWVKNRRTYKLTDGPSTCPPALDKLQPSELGAEINNSANNRGRVCAGRTRVTRN